MKPPKVGPCQGPHSDFDMFWSQLANIINMCHELVRLADAIDWCFFYKRLSISIQSGPRANRRV